MIQWTTSPEIISEMTDADLCRAYISASEKHDDPEAKRCWPRSSGAGSTYE